MRSLVVLSINLFVYSQVTHTFLLGTDVVIVSNNDLDPSNQNRTGALLLRTPLPCSEAVSTCTQLQETLLPLPTSTGFTSENLTSVLVSGRHGAALAPGSSVWIAGNRKSPFTPLHPSSNSPQLAVRHSLWAVHPHMTTRPTFPPACPPSVPTLPR